jgi:hypothetical protein
MSRFSTTTCSGATIPEEVSVECSTTLVVIVCANRSRFGELSEMAAYDDSVLQQHADALYREAEWIVTKTAAVFGFGIFCVAAILVGGFSALQNVPASENLFTGQVIIVGLLTAVGVCTGVLVGRQKAFRLRLQAQTVLCQRQIEINTRK